MDKSVTINNFLNNHDLTFSHEELDGIIENVLQKIREGETLYSAFSVVECGLLLHYELIRLDYKSYRQRYKIALFFCREMLRDKRKKILEGSVMTVNVIEQNGIKMRCESLQNDINEIDTMILQLGKDRKGSMRSKLEAAETKVMNTEISGASFENDAMRYQQMQRALRTEQEVCRTKQENVLFEKLGASGDIIDNAIKIVEGAASGKKFVVDK